MISSEHFYPPTNWAVWKDWPKTPPPNWLQMTLWRISPITMKLIPWNA